MFSLNKAKAKYRYSLILLKELVITDFKLRYQGSALGYMWSLLKPLLLFTVLYFVFVQFLKIGNDIPNWPVAMLLGIVFWTFFSEVTNNGLNSIVSRSDVIRKINFPKYIIVLAGSLSAAINLVINLSVVIVMMLLAGVKLHFSMLILPVFLIELFIFGLGVAFMLSALYVKYRDIQYIWEVLLQILFYASVVIYPIAMIYSQNATMAKIMMLNPVAQAIQDSRHFFINTSNMSIFDVINNNFIVLIPYAIVFITFIAGAAYFRKKAPYFAENV